MSALAHAFGWARSVRSRDASLPDHGRAAVATTAAARSNIKHDAHRRAMLLAKRCELAAVADVMREFSHRGTIVADHGTISRRAMLKAQLVEHRAVADVLKQQSASTQGALHQLGYIPRSQDLSLEELAERDERLLNFLEHISQGADARCFEPLRSETEKRRRRQPSSEIDVPVEGIL